MVEYESENNKIFQGIRVEVIGQIELFNDRSNTHDFLFTVKHLTGPDTLLSSRLEFGLFMTENNKSF